MKNLIFTSGYLEGDDELTSMKGHRSDVIVEDDKGRFYELNFITLDRLKVDLLGNKEKGRNYFTDTGLIILYTISKDAIVDTVYSLIEGNFFSGQKAEERIKTSDWFVIPL